MYKILITGGAGYIGSVLVPHLLRQGYEVTVIDNLMYKQYSLSACCSWPNFRFIKGDIRDRDLRQEELTKSDIIIPLAALVGAPLCAANPADAKSINLDAQLDLLSMLSKEQRVLMPVTNSGYGTGENDKVYTEESPLNPISIYGIYKAQVENTLMQRENSISFRLATVFGMSPRPRLDLLVNDFVYRAFFDRYIVLFESHFKRNYIHIDDVSRVFALGVLNFEKMRGNIYNVGLSSANLSKFELCQQINKHLPNFVFIESSIGEDPDKRNYIVSNEKLETTGWSPLFDLDHGINELIKGMPMLKQSSYSNF